MDSIKEFMEGQTAYLVGDRRGNKANGPAVEVEVLKVGRTYVTIGEGEYKLESKYGIRHRMEPYLVEKVDIGVKRLLFRTKEDVEAYQERNRLLEWFVKATEWTRREKYTLEQLRAVKKILQEDSDNEES